MTNDWSATGPAPTAPAKLKPRRKRIRATIVAEQGGKVLIIRERGSKQYSLPGGGIEHGEYTMEAALRELREETKLRPYKGGAAVRLRRHHADSQSCPGAGPGPGQAATERGVRFQVVERPGSWCLCSPRRGRFLRSAGR